MALHVTVLAADPATEKKWAQALKAASEDISGISIGIASEQSAKDYGQVLFLDGAMRDIDSRLDDLDREGRAVFVIVPEQLPLDIWADWIRSGKLDDVLVHPFRAAEVQSKLRGYQQIVLWDEVSKLNASFSGVVQRLQEDLQLAERLQKRKSPIRFPEIKGFTVKSRYLAGMKSGGDHLDLAESASGNQLSIVLSDSSSYGLSSALLSVLMRMAVKLSADEVRSCEETVQRIHEEVALTLSEKDRLSLFYGIVSRKDYRLRYVNLGTSCAFYAAPGQSFQTLPSQGVPITATGSLGGKALETELALEPGGRLALLSDGFLEVMGGEAQILNALNRFRETESADFLNEIVFQLKSQFAEPGDVPAQDCTAILFDVDARILRKL